MISHPNGVMGVLVLKSEGPRIWEYADSLGLMREVQSKFSVMVIWGMTRSQQSQGNASALECADEMIFVCLDRAFGIVSLAVSW